MKVCISCHLNLSERAGLWRCARPHRQPLGVVLGLSRFLARSTAKERFCDSSPPSRMELVAELRRAWSAGPPSGSGPIPRLDFAARVCARRSSGGCRAARPGPGRGRPRAPRPIGAHYPIQPLSAPPNQLTTSRWPVASVSVEASARSGTAPARRPSPATRRPFS